MGKNKSFEKRNSEYRQIMDQIEASPRFGREPGVILSGRMLEKLDKPQAGIPYIHVAGTNGKGSVCAFLAEIMMEHGWKTGLFTSPHLVNFEERIRVDGRPIPEQDLVRLGKQVLACGDISYFDFCLGLAALYFREQKVDLAIYETGLGGRLDSTNALGNPSVCVITKIGFDHTAVLGNSLSEIASEKTGILRPDVPLVTEIQEDEAMEVIRKRAETLGADCRRVEQPDIDAVKDLELKMAGDYQWENGACALLAAECFLGREKALGAFDREKACRALRKTVWPGRMQIVSEKPFLLLDGAHNGHGVAALAGSLKSMYPGEKFHLTMAVMADKDYEKMLELILPLAKSFTAVSLESGRALQSEKLAEAISGKGIPVRTVSSVGQALGNLSTDGRNVFFGSLYFIGEVLGNMQVP